MKSRNAEELDGVIACQIVNKGFLTFEIIGMDEEKNHLPTIDNSDQQMEAAVRLRKEGKTLDQIGTDLKVNKSTVSRWFKK